MPPSPTARTPRPGRALRRALTSAALALTCVHPSILLAQRTGRSDRDVADSVGLTVRELKELRVREGVTNENIESMSEPALREIRERLFQPDLPAEEAKYRDMLAGGASASAQVVSLLRAAQELEASRSRRDASSVARTTVAGVPVGLTLFPCLDTLSLTDPCRWVALGPTNVGGRVRSVLATRDRVTQKLTVWLGSLGGGIWRSDDGGATFDLTAELMANLVVSTMAASPRDPNVIYAGTGEGFFNNESINRGAGIFRTTNGRDWSQLAATGPDNPDFAFVNRIAVSADGAVVLAATQSGVWRSDGADREVWTKTISGRMAEVDFHPTEAGRAVAGSLQGGRAYFTTDGGLTWRLAEHDGVWLGRVELAYARADPSIVYASLDQHVDDDPGDSTPPRAVGGEVWRSTDGGQKYVKMRGVDSDSVGPSLSARPATYLGRYGFHANLIWAGHPTDPNFLILGGPELWRSTDGGHTLTTITDRSKPGSLHVDHHCVAPIPPAPGGGNDKAAFLCNDGGLARTPDITTAGSDPARSLGWQRVQGLNITQFHSGAGNPKTRVIVGGVMDNGTQRFVPAQGAGGWAEVDVENGGADGGVCAFDPQDDRFVYGETQYLGLHRSTDGGRNALRIDGRYFAAPNHKGWSWKNEPFRIPDSGSQRSANFVAPFALDPADPNRLLAGGKSLWRTRNAREPNVPYEPKSGPTWRKVEIQGNTGSIINAITITPGRPEVVWVGHNDGSVFVTGDGLSDAPSWRRADESTEGRLPDRVCTKIVIAPSDPNTVYATFGGFTRGNVWRTTDGGLRWQQLDVGGSIPETPIYDIAVHPSRPNFLYVGTAVGLLASDDGGATWHPTSQGPVNCSVQDLFWMDTTLIAVTHGRGMFRIDL